MFGRKKATVRYSIDGADVDISGEAEVRGNLDGRSIAKALAEYNSQADGVEYSPERVQIHSISK